MSNDKKLKMFEKNGIHMTYKLFIEAIIFSGFDLQKA
jgi:hypothetical protein